MAEAELDEDGRPEVPPDGTEATLLLAFLDTQRATLEWKCRGLSDEQLRQGLPSTDITLGGLLKHLARVEDGWFSEVVAEGPPVAPWDQLEWAAEWRSAASDTGEQLRRLWTDRVDASRAVVARRLAAGEAALADTHPAWEGQGRASLRWVLVHMIEEYARHNGHADLLREAIDGQTGE